MNQNANCGRDVVSWWSEQRCALSLTLSGPCIRTRLNVDAGLTRYAHCVFLYDCVQARILVPASAVLMRCLCA